MLVFPEDFLTIDPVAQMDWIEAQAPRSPKWRAFVDKLVAKHPFCAFCGETEPSTRLIGHHIIPYHVRPDLELTESNIMIVGDSCSTGNHHLFACHFGNFSKWNPDAIELAETFLQNRMRKLDGYEPIRIYRDRNDY